MNGKIENSYINKISLSSTAWNKVPNSVHSRRITYGIKYKRTHAIGIRYGIRHIK